MPHEPSVWYFILHANFAVKCVMIILILISITSWTIIFQRRSLYKQTKCEAAAFKQQFWSGIHIDEFYQQLSQSNTAHKGLAAIFIAGYNEFQRFNQYGDTPPNVTIEGTERAMRLAITDELNDLQQHLPFLATAGSTSPYIGLFGTVWGIMSSFSALGQVQQASIAMVAPGISEALIATAIGLFAAIPAVIAYNRFSNQLELIDDQYLKFHDELIHLLHREAHQPTI